MSILILRICFGHFAGIQFCGSPICTTARICCNNLVLSCLTLSPPKNVVSSILSHFQQSSPMELLKYSYQTQYCTGHPLIGMAYMLRAEFVNSSTWKIRLAATHSAATYLENVPSC